MVLGHESAGTVVDVGPGAKKIKVGDRVAMEPGTPCRKCLRCREGRYNLCEDIKFAAAPPVDGTLTKYYILPDDFCYKLPDNVSTEEGALLEPLSVAVHALNQTKLKEGDSIVIFGAGPVGLLCCAVARVRGASKIIAVDIQAERLNFAISYAASGIYRSDKIPAAENAAKIIQQHDLGLGADVAVDASGSEACIEAAIHVLRKGGSYVQAGMGRDKCSFPIMDVCIKELLVSGSFRYGPGDYATALSMIASGRVDVKPLISKKMVFHDAEDAFHETRMGTSIKILIKGP